MPSESVRVVLSFVNSSTRYPLGSSTSSLELSSLCEIQAKESARPLSQSDRKGKREEGIGERGEGRGKRELTLRRERMFFGVFLDVGIDVNLGRDCSEPVLSAMSREERERRRERRSLHLPQGS